MLIRQNPYGQSQPSMGGFVGGMVGRLGGMGGGAAAAGPNVGIPQAGMVPEYAPIQFAPPDDFDFIQAMQMRQGLGGPYAPR